MLHHFGKHFLGLALILILGVVLNGCSGGSDSVVNPTSTSVPDSSTVPVFAAARLNQGDWFTYAETLNAVSADGSLVSYSSFLTRYVKTVNQDGSLVLVQAISNPDLTGGSTTTLDATGGMVEYDINEFIGITIVGFNFEPCTFSTPFVGVLGRTPGFERVTGSYSVGSKWNYASVADCSAPGGMGTDRKLTNEGAIVAVEDLSVQGITFHTLKEVYSITDESTSVETDDINKTDYTCWRDTVSGRVVRCDIVSKTIPAGSTDARLNSSSTFELVRYSVNGVGSALTPSLYAGRWAVSYAGPHNGYCSELVVSTQGDVSGTCTIASTAFSLTGSVAADGTILFSSASGDVTFAGRLNNPVAGAGTWTATAIGDGSWTMEHR